MATRWALDDLSGKILDKNPRAKELSFPAINEAGEALIPELHPIDKLLETKDLLGSYFWSAMYMQSPFIQGGGIFKAEWWRYYRELPLLRYRAMYVDTALKTKEQNDFTVFQVWGKASNGAYLIDQLRGKWEAPELLVQARAFWNKHKAPVKNVPLRSMDVEDKASGTGLIQTLQKAGDIPVRAVQRNIDKISRAYDVTPQIESGRVYIPEGAEWLSDYLAEFAQFPNGIHDDQVDPTIDAINEMLVKDSVIDYSEIL
jgi:predicted phage terminase large subunit-like protein